jgi:hypothetical protein
MWLMLQLHPAIVVPEKKLYSAKKEGHMSSQEQQTIKRETIMNVRKLAALDIVFHDPRLILAEFAVAVIVGSGLGILQFFVFFRTPGHPLAVGLVAVFFSCIGLNYVPLLLYAISIVRRKSAQQEVAFELERKEFYARKYTLQSAWLLLPLVVPILAIFQEMQKRSRRNHQS